MTDKYIRLLLIFYMKSTRDLKLANFLIPFWSFFFFFVYRKHLRGTRVTGYNVSVIRFGFIA